MLCATTFSRSRLYMVKILNLNLQQTKERAKYTNLYMKNEINT